MCPGWGSRVNQVEKACGCSLAPGWEGLNIGKFMRWLVSLAITVLASLAAAAVPYAPGEVLFSLRPGAGKVARADGSAGLLGNCRVMFVLD